MTKILITGATGNVGMEVVKALTKYNKQFEIYAGIRNLGKDKLLLDGFELNSISFDFTDINSFKPALIKCDVLFLLRPPQISEITQFFKPLIEVAVQCLVKHIVFLSVQGVEKSRIIPHNKIEKLILDSRIPYTFLRPAYFMQNFTTTLRNDLVLNKRIFLPAGNSKFTLIDVTDLGKVAAKILTENTNHVNQSYELTNREKLTFGEMAEKLSKGLNRIIKYESPNLLEFFLVKRKEQIPIMLILVMIMLHYLPRFQKAPNTTDWVKQITNDEPKSFDEFIVENQNKLQ